MEYTLTSGSTTLTVSSHGAEMVSLKRDGVEYLWNGDAKYWNRHAPVLFPFVGQVRDKKYRWKGVEYPMGQHGFARDKEFTLVDQEEDQLIFQLDADEETKKVYPFDFQLIVGYTLDEGSVEVVWNVVNPGRENLYFSIGGHPAFMCPVNGEGDWGDYRIEFRQEGEVLREITTRPITTGGNVGDATIVTALDEQGRLTPTDELLGGDALILEDCQCDEISLAKAGQDPYLTVSFGTPVVGVWSPVGKHAPFICIEPWYGRTDRDSFTGELDEREYGNVLAPGAEFLGGYTVEFG